MGEEIVSVALMLLISIKLIADAGQSTVARRLGRGLTAAIGPVVLILCYIVADAVYDVLRS